MMKVLRSHTVTDNQFYEHSGYAVYSECRINCNQFNSAWDAAHYAVKNNVSHVTERVINKETGIEIDGKSIPIIETDQK